MGRSKCVIVILDPFLGQIEYWNQVPVQKWLLAGLKYMAE